MYWLPQLVAGPTGNLLLFCRLIFLDQDRCVGMDCLLGLSAATVPSRAPNEQGWANEHPYASVSSHISQYSVSYVEQLVLAKYTTMETTVLYNVVTITSRQN